MKISFAKQRVPAKGSLVLAVCEGPAWDAAGKAVDKASKGYVTHMAAKHHFKGKRGQVLTLLSPEGLGVDRLVLLGLGEAKELNAQQAAEAGGAAYAALPVTQIKDASAIIDFDGNKGLEQAEAAAHFALGFNLRAYRFDKYFTKRPKDKIPTLSALTVLTSALVGAQKEYKRQGAVAEGVRFARDLVSEPSNVLFPASLAAQCQKLKKMRVKVSVLQESDMRKLGMGSLLGVAQGSAHAPRLVVMNYTGNPRAKNKKPVAFIGKGVTFDTGGISLKPASGMEDMKYDMAGSAAVIGTMVALAKRKAKVNAVGVVGLVENMPDGNAQRPGDVVRSMSGQTIEVINTDAEGRLVLCDLLTYTQEKLKPQAMVNLATLTGAIVLALGNEHAGLFSNDDKLSEQLLEAGKATEEKLWRFPMNDAYDRQLNSDIADMKNASNERVAGSIFGAQFLARFVDKKVPWAHLDIAGMAWARRDLPLIPKGATAYGVRLLEKLVADHYEGK